MEITKKMLSVVQLAALSVTTFLKALPAIIIVYFIPALLLMIFVAPFLADVPQLFAAQQGAAPMVAFFAVLQQILMRPQVAVVSLLFAFIYFYSLCVAYLVTEGIVNKEKSSLRYIIPQSVIALPRLIAAYLAFAGIVILFALGPYIPSFFIMLTPIANFLVFLLWLFCLLFIVVFAFTSMFFGRVAVLREKWPRHAFYYSYKLVYKHIFRLIAFLIIITAINLALYMVINMFIGIPLAIFASFVNINAAQASLPFSIISNGVCAFFSSVALTVYFLNMDYMLNRDNKRMEVFSRVAAINDNSMPVLK